MLAEEETIVVWKLVDFPSFEWAITSLLRF